MTRWLVHLQIREQLGEQLLQQSQLKVKLDVEVEFTADTTPLGALLQAVNEK